MSSHPRLSPLWHHGHVSLHLFIGDQNYPDKRIYHIYYYYSLRLWVKVSQLSSIIWLFLAPTTLVTASSGYFTIEKWFISLSLFPGHSTVLMLGGNKDYTSTVGPWVDLWLLLNGGVPLSLICMWKPVCCSTALEVLWWWCVHPSWPALSTARIQHLTAFFLILRVVLKGDASPIVEN